MRVEVSRAIDELRLQFPGAQVISIDDGSGGASVIVEPVELGSRFVPQVTWIGGRLTAQYPYADVYPVFIGAEVRRADGAALQAPVTSGHTFAGRPALQISRRSPTAEQASQSVRMKFLKVIHFLETMA